MTVADPLSMPDDFDALGNLPHEPATGRPSIRRLFWGVLRRPRVTLTHIAERSGKIWVVPILALVLTGTAAAIVMIPSSREAARRLAIEQFERSGAAAETGDPEEAAEQAAVRDQTLDVMLRFTGIATVVGAIASPFIAVLVLTAVLHLTGTILGGQQSYGQMLAVASWARVPLLFQDGLRLIYGLGGGFDERMNGLAGLVAADHLAGPILAEISVWNLWALALTSVGVGVVSHVSRGKAIGAVIVVVVLRVLLGEVGVAMGRAFAGFGG